MVQPIIDYSLLFLTLSERKVGSLMIKKILTVLLAVCLSFLLISCGEIGKVEDAIDAIGIVTMESQISIEYAEQLYKGIPAEQQDKVKNYSTLIEARKRWNQLSDAVSDARHTISGIGNVTIDSGNVIKEARTAYDALQQNGLTGYVADIYCILLDAEGQYDAIIREYAKTLLAEANTLLKNRKYQESYDLFSLILEEYNCSEVSAEAKHGCADALVAIATQQYNKGNLEDTMYAVEEIINNYGSTDSVRDLKEKIELRLTQNRPANGKTFKNNVGWGNGEFTVKASNSDACIKLENRNDSSKYILFYVRANESATVKVKDGDYIAKYATGKYWYNTDSYFGKETSFTKADDILSYETTRSGSYVYYSTIEITLYQVIGGNLTTTPIRENEF